MCRGSSRTVALTALVLATRSAHALHSLSGNLERDAESLQALTEYSFDAFVRDYKKEYQTGTEDWTRRMAIFEANKHKILEFQALPSRKWNMGINHLMDWSDAEYKGLLGLRLGKNGPRDLNLARSTGTFSNRSKVPPPVEFELKQTKALLTAKNQGNCGSCWAIAAVGALESVLDMQLSVETVVACSPNPDECGGKGACDGATSEIAYEYMRQHGVPKHVEAHLDGEGWKKGTCNSGTQNPIHASGKVWVNGFEILPRNQLEPLKNALLNGDGAPVSLGVDASYWQAYQNGIYSDLKTVDEKTGLKGEFTINHAVLLTAYKSPTEEDPEGFWKIRNSWGPTWGEAGFIRIEMKLNEEQHCGIDWDTRKGIACKGDPTESWICGTCGILYNTAVVNGIKWQR